MDGANAIRTRLRRWYVPDGTYFITAVTRDRAPLFADERNVALLRETMRQARTYHPFTMHAYVLLPDHLHLLIRLGEQTNISKLMQSVQWNYTRNHKRERGLAGPLHLWQRGFWDHVIRDEADLERHFDYIHYNPVKHGYVSGPADYPHSSFGEYVRRGWYGPAWGGGAVPAGLADEVSEPA